MKKVAAKRASVRTRKSPSKQERAAPRSVYTPPPDNFPIRRILVPIDFSIHSKNALRYSLLLAEQFDASLHLVYVVEPTIYPADLGFGQVVLPEVEEELRDRGVEELRSLVQREVGDRVRAATSVRTGKPHQEILAEAEERKADLIVVASHGHTGVEHMLFGSTAMRIVRLAKCPVLTVRP